jgi:peptidoglycan hydrolase-like protein with peptidoglycan-binding domain
MHRILAASLLSTFLCAFSGLGQTSDTVRRAQQTLKDKGYDPGPIDGINGPRTQAAVRNYQEKEHLDTDGQLGPKTLDNLGVKPASAGTQFGEAGENVKSSYSKGGKDMAEGTKEAGSALKHGEVVDGAKDFGKGVGHGAAQVGAGTGHAAKNAAKGVKSAVSGDTNKHK